MERVVDLDLVADRLRPVIEEWAQWAETGPLTWRDGTAAWPQPIERDRAMVGVPESLGLKLSRRASGDEFIMVVWTGGWADVDFLLGDSVYSASPEFGNVDGAYAAVVELVEAFRDERPGSEPVRVAR